MLLLLLLTRPQGASRASPRAPDVARLPHPQVPQLQAAEARKGAGPTPLLRSSPGSTPQGPGVFQGHCEPCVPSARLQRRSPAPVQSWALGGSGTLPRAQVGEFINFLGKGLLLFNCWNEKVSRETQPPALPTKRTEALHPSQPQLEAQAGTFELRSWGSLGIESPCFHSGPRLHTYTHYTHTHTRAPASTGTVHVHLSVQGHVSGCPPACRPPPMCHTHRCQHTHCRHSMNVS